MRLARVEGGARITSREQDYYEGQRAVWHPAPLGRWDGFEELGRFWPFDTGPVHVDADGFTIRVTSTTIAKEVEWTVGQASPVT